VVPKAELDNAQTNYDSALSQLKSLEEQLNQQQVELHYYRVSAPMDGIVGDIPVRMGDRVSVNTLLTTVDEPGALEAYIYVPADRARDLKMGAPVYLVDDSGKKLADSRITFVSPEVDPETQTVLAKAAVENSQGRLRVSQQVRAQVVWKLRSAATSARKCTPSCPAASAPAPLAPAPALLAARLPRPATRCRPKSSRSPNQTAVQ